MPTQDRTVTDDICPLCHARTGNGGHLYAPNGAPMPTQAPTDQPEQTPHQAEGQQTQPPEVPIQTLQFWQGLAAGLAAAVVILFLVAVILAS